LYRAFNWGIGLFVVCPGAHAEPLLGQRAAAGTTGAVRSGHVGVGGDGVRSVAG
jgi:hypothetical protein